MTIEDGNFPPKIIQEYKNLQKKWNDEDCQDKRAGMVEEATVLLADAPEVLGRVIRNIALAPDEQSNDQTGS